MVTTLSTKQSVVDGSWRQRSSVPWMDFAALLAAGFIALRFLAKIWMANPDYEFGWAVPFLAAYLVAERWSRRPERRPASRDQVALALVLLGWTGSYLVARLLLEVVPDWRPGLWLATSLYLGAVTAWCWLYGGRAWAAYFFFAIAFLLCGVPWLYQLESPLLEGLMRWNALLVADSLTLVDIPAQAAGNTLVLATGRLGIEEACSGLRSLQAALMMALFLGAFYQFATARRGWLLLIAAGFAFAGNYLRLLTLAWRGAHFGIASVESWHDSAGAGVLAFTILGLWSVCGCLRENKIEGSAPGRPPMFLNPAKSNRAASFWAAGILGAVVLSEAITQGWFAWREVGMHASPAMSVLWPESAPGYRVLPIASATHRLLGDVASKSGMWRDAQGWQWSALWFKYPPQAANKIAADVHNPEVCLPAAGMRESADYGFFRGQGATASVQIHGYLFTAGTGSEYVFWISNLDPPDGATSRIGNGRTIYRRGIAAPWGRLGLWAGDIWRGVRRTDEQTLEVSIFGAPDYLSAHAAFLNFLRASVVESLPRPASPALH